MARKNKRSEKRTPQHPRGHARPRGFHRKSTSPGEAKTTEFLDRWREEPDERKDAA